MQNYRNVSGNVLKIPFSSQVLANRNTSFLFFIIVFSGPCSSRANETTAFPGGFISVCVHDASTFSQEKLTGIEGFK